MDNIFNTTILDNDDKQNLSKNDVVKELCSKIQCILEKTFPNNPSKQRIKVYKDRISFAAPCCGDSTTDNSKKRGNIILEGKFKNLYKCHNCGECMSVYRFFKKFGETLSNNMIDYVITTSRKNTDTYTSKGITDSNTMNLFFDEDIINDYAIDREYLKKVCNLEECNIANYANVYLRKRCQMRFDKFLYSRSKNFLFVLNLTPSGKIIGIQIRNLNSNFIGPKYKTYKLSNIYSILLNTNKTIPDNIENISNIFNFLLIDYNKPITVVEGPLDSFLINNCIASCGAGHSLPMEFNYRYVFDDDETGRKHAIDKINQGYSVFMWDKYKNNILLPKRKKWDINDLIIYAASNHIKLPKLDEYYSSDSLDLLDI